MHSMTRSKKSDNKPRLKVFSFEAIGTQWSIEYVATPSDMNGIETAVRQRIELFDRAYSRFRDDSFITYVSKKADSYELPADARPLFDFYFTLYDLTDGAVNPLVGGTLSDAGYDAAYSFRFKRRTVAPPLGDVLRITDKELVTQEAVLIDLGAAGKGYLVDIICDLLKSQGVDQAVVNAGGDIRVLSLDSTLVDIALEYPGDSSQAIGVVRLSSGSLCGSATKLRSWGDYHHVIDPRTAESPSRILAVWVTAETAMLADGIATALFFEEPQRLLKAFAFEYAIIHADYSLDYSMGFPARFFDEEGDD